MFPLGSRKKASLRLAPLLIEVGGAEKDLLRSCRWCAARPRLDPPSGARLMLAPLPASPRGWTSADVGRAEVGPGRLAGKVRPTVVTVCVWRCTKMSNDSAFAWNSPLI